MVENHKTVYVWCTASQGQIPKIFSASCVGVAELVARVFFILHKITQRYERRLATFSVF